MKAWSYGCGATCSRGNGFGQVLPEQAVLRFALGGQESRAGQKLIEIALGTVDEAVQRVKTYQLSREVLVPTRRWRGRWRAAFCVTGQPVALDRLVKISLTTLRIEPYKSARPEPVANLDIASKAGNRGGGGVVLPLVLAAVSGGLVYVMHGMW